MKLFIMTLANDIALKYLKYVLGIGLGIIWMMRILFVNELKVSMKLCSSLAAPC